MHQDLVLPPFPDISHLQLTPKKSFVYAVHSAGQRPAASKPTAAEEAGLVDALLRYHFYAELGIDPRHIAPFREEWLGNALSMVPNEPPPHVSEVSGPCQWAVVGAQVSVMHLHWTDTLTMDAAAETLCHLGSC